MAKTKNPYWRAAIWATTIVGGALVLTWLPHIIWPPHGTPNLLALILSGPGFVAQAPGMLIITFVRSLAYMTFHHAEIVSAMAASNDNCVYVVLNGFDLTLSYTFLWSVLVNWAFYYFIAERVLKLRAKRISGLAG